MADIFIKNGENTIMVNGFSPQNIIVSLDTENDIPKEIYLPDPYTHMKVYRVMYQMIYIEATEYTEDSLKILLDYLIFRYCF